MIKLSVLSFQTISTQKPGKKLFSFVCYLTLEKALIDVRYALFPRFILDAMIFLNILDLGELFLPSTALDNGAFSASCEL